MASTIKLKNGSGAPLAGDLVQGEPAFDLTNKRLYTENSGGTVIEVGTNPSTIDINAGTIDGTTIGATTPASIAGTTGTFSATVQLGNAQNINWGGTYASNYPTIEAAVATGFSFYPTGAAGGRTVHFSQTGAATFSGNIGLAASATFPTTGMFHRSADTKLHLVGGASGFSFDDAAGASTLVAISNTGAATFSSTLSATQLTSTSSSASLPGFAVSAGNGLVNSGANALGFATNSTIGMTLDASGNLLVGLTTSVGSASSVAEFSDGISLIGASVGNGTFIQSADSAGAEIAYLSMGRSYNAAGTNEVALALNNIAANASKRLMMINRTLGVSLADGGTSWTSLSDERFKDIIEPITDAASKLSTLRTVIGKYKSEEDRRRVFFIAQDVQAVLPEAVDDTTEPDRLSMSYTDVVPLVAAAVNEHTGTIAAQQAIIDALTARLDAAGL